MFFKKKSKKIGITFSTFDLFHAGHVKMVEEAKSVCDYLIVGLATAKFFTKALRLKYLNPQKTCLLYFFEMKKPVKVCQQR